MSHKLARSYARHRPSNKMQAPVALRCCVPVMRYRFTKATGATRHISVDFGYTKLRCYMRSRQ